jgi:hypothetical protein
MDEKKTALNDCASKILRGWREIAIGLQPAVGSLLHFDGKHADSFEGIVRMIKFC